MQSMNDQPLQAMSPKWNPAIGREVFINAILVNLQKVWESSTNYQYGGAR